MVPVCAHVYECVHEIVYAYMYGALCVHICMHSVCVHEFVCACMHVLFGALCAHTCTCVYVASHVCVCVSLCMCLCVCTHMHSPEDTGLTTSAGGNGWNWVNGFSTAFRGGGGLSAGSETSSRGSSQEEPLLPEAGAAALPSTTPGSLPRRRAGPCGGPTGRPPRPLRSSRESASEASGADRGRQTRWCNRDRHTLPPGTDKGRSMPTGGL